MSATAEGIALIVLGQLVQFLFHYRDNREQKQLLQAQNQLLKDQNGILSSIATKPSSPLWR